MVSGVGHPLCCECACSLPDGVSDCPWIQGDSGRETGMATGIKLSEGVVTVGFGVPEVTWSGYSPDWWGTPRPIPSGSGPSGSDVSERYESCGMV